MMPEVAEPEKDEIGDDGGARRITYFVMLEVAAPEQDEVDDEDDEEAKRITYL